MEIKNAVSLKHSEQMKKLDEPLVADVSPVILFFNNSKEDKQAYRLLKGSGIPCEFRAPAIGEPCLDEEPSRPLLVVGYSKHIGFEEIEKYVKGAGQ